MGAEMRVRCRSRCNPENIAHQGGQPGRPWSPAAGTEEQETAPACLTLLAPTRQS